MLKKRLAILGTLLVLAACSSTPLPTVTPFPSPGWPTPTLRPSPTAPALPSASPLPSATASPTATPLPVQHAVTRGEDMFGIALRYGIALEALKTANPAIDPYSMAEGSLLTIPLTPTPLPPAEPTAAADAGPTQTPLPVSCYRDVVQTITCLVSYTNSSERAVENPSAIVTVSAEEGAFSQSRTAILPLDRLKPGETLPLVVRFAGPTPANFSAQAFFEDELPTMPEDGRYLDMPEAQVEVEMAANERQGDLVIDLPAEAEAAGRLRVLAVAWNAQGRPQGWRMVDLNAPIDPREPVRLQVFSLGDKIARVSVHLEARPQE